MTESNCSGCPAFSLKRLERGNLEFYCYKLKMKGAFNKRSEFCMNSIEKHALDLLCDSKTTNKDIKEEKIPETYFVYIIRYKSKGIIKYYTGYTNNPERRFKEHKQGKGAYCLRHSQIEKMSIIFQTTDRIAALREEQHIKHMKPIKKHNLYYKNLKGFV